MRNKTITILFFFIMFALFATELTAQWSKCKCLYRDNVYSFTAIENMFFAGTNAGIIRSTDGGLTWENKSSGLLNYTVMAMATVDNIIYAGTQFGLFRSSDKGETWLGTTLSSAKISYLLTSKSDLYINLGTSLYRSKKGSKPELFSINMPSDSIVDIVANDSVIYVSGKKGIYRTTDDGFNWSDITTSLPKSKKIVFGQSHGKVYAGVEGDGIYKTTIGLVWNKVFDKQNGNIVEIISTNEKVIALCENEIFISTDDGSTWKKEQDIVGNVVQQAIIEHRENLIVGTQEDGIYIHNDKSEWDNVGFLCKNAQSVNRVGSTLYSSLGEQYYRSDDNGNSWLPTPIRGVPLGNDTVMYYLKSLTKNRNNLYKYYSKKNITDSIVMPKNVQSVNCFQVHNNDVYIGTNRGVFKSTDEGNTWLVWGLTGSAIEKMYNLRASIVAGSNLKKMYRTQISDTLWSDMNFPYTVHNSIVEIGDRIFVASKEGLMYSENNGNIWQNIGFMNRNITQMIATDKYLVMAIDSTVIASNPTGNIWYLSGNLGATINDVTLIGEQVFAGATNGVWKANIHSVFTSIPLFPNDEVEAFSIYPIPAKEYITIRNSVNTGSVVYNILNTYGETILSETIPAGFETYTLSIHTLPAGMYIFSAEVSGKKLNQKVIVQ